MKYFFGWNVLHYAHLMPVHLAQMNTLEVDDPETWDAFVVGKSDIQFSHLFTNQALKQEIKKLKGHGGGVLEFCLCLTTPGLRKDIQRQIQQLYWHEVIYYVYYYYILSSLSQSRSHIYFYY